MTFIRCPRRAEVQELLDLGHFPQAAAPELRDHVAACRGCADLVLVTAALRLSRGAAAAQAHLPAPGVLWWRAQLRMRNSAIQRVTRPILGANIFALVLMLAVAVAALIPQGRHGFHWLAWFGLSSQSEFSPSHLGSFFPAALFDSGWNLAVLISILGTLALLSAVAIYLVSEKQ